jgi:hypothetical protein
MRHKKLIDWPFCKDYNSLDIKLQNSISSNLRPNGGGRKGSTSLQYLEHSAQLLVVCIITENNEEWAASKCDITVLGSGMWLCTISSSILAS